MRIITVSREFGSGGREIGKRLAEALGVAYYDREIIIQIAKNLKLNEDYIEKVLERSYTVNFPYTFGRTFTLFPSTDEMQIDLISEQARIIRDLAEKSDCVIVGRAADILLREKNPLNIFVYADLPAKLERCRKRAPENENLSDREMERMIRRIDKERAANYRIVSDCGWGEREAYHLCVNTTGLEIPSLVPILADYAKFWFDCREKSQNE